MKFHHVDTLGRCYMKKTGPKERTKEQIEADFWKKVDKKGLDDCWLWLGWKSNDGYGLLTLDKREYGAHRFSLELHLGRKLVGEECALHDCPGGDNPSCVNPAHLWVGTRTDNGKDMWKKGRGKNGFPNQRGHQNYQALLTEDQVSEIKRRIKRGRHGIQRKLAREFNVHEATISEIKLGHSWKHVS